MASQSEPAGDTERATRRGRDGGGRCDAGLDQAHAREQLTLEELLELVPDAFLGVSDDGAIAFANAHAEAMFGYASEELIGKPLELLLPERLAEGHRAHRASYFADPRPRAMGERHDLAGMRHDGSEVPVDVSLSSVELDGVRYGTAAIRDLTEPVALSRVRDRLRDEVRLEKATSSRHTATRLESLVQAAAGIAHDFNNLLSVIINYSAFLGEDLRNSEVPMSLEKLASMRGDLEQVSFAAERAARLTQQLLAFARNQIVQPEAVSINEAVTAVTTLLRQTLGERVELRCELEREPAPVLIDAGQLEQILVNLIVNARDAMPAGGVLTIDTGSVEPAEDRTSEDSGEAPGPRVRLRVTDTGAGMERAVAERAFEPFFTTKPAGKGSGLGLATTYGIIRQAGGEVWIDSEPSVGTTVTVQLPTTDGPVVRRQRPVDPTSLRGSGTILLVEDEPAVREIARRLLAGAGYEVIAAAGGDAAITAARDHQGQIDLLLTDVAMPGMDGLELAERLRSDRPGTRVMFMSGSAKADWGAQPRYRGEVLVEKPLSPTTLLARVRQVLGGPGAGPDEAQAGA